MIEIGRVCTKIAGREAGMICVVVDVIDKNYCLIDGPVRRKKCNFTHLDPLDKTLNLEKGASHVKVVLEFKKIGVEIKEKVKKEKKAQEKKSRKTKEDKQETAAGKPKKEKKEKKDTKK